MTTEAPINPVDAPTAADIFGDRPPVRLSTRPSLAGLAEKSGVYRLKAGSPAEDIRDSLDALRAEAVAAQLDATDRAALSKVVLDALAEAGVKNARPIVRAALEPKATSEAANAQSGTAILLADPQPWPDPIEGADALEATAATIRQYVVTTAAQSDAIALWVGSAYVIDALAVAPILGITSATMRAGKSTLCAIIGALTPRALLVSSVTPAVLYRLIEAHRPTLIGDEADTWLTDEKSELRGILNAGHTRATATVARCVGDDHEVRLYSVFAARLLAMIGKPPATVRDRSIIVELRRKTATERVDRLRIDRLHGDLSPLRSQWKRWADDHLELIQRADPAVPNGLHDRAADCWRPLLAIADLAAGDWPARARRAAAELSGSVEADESIGVELLADIRGIYDDRSGADVVASAELVAELVAMADRPWAEWSHGRPLTAAKLARLLKPFGVVGGDYRLPAGVKRGYRRTAFCDAWARYIPAKAQHVDNLNKDGLESLKTEVQHVNGVGLSQSSTNPMNTGVSRPVGLSRGGSGVLDFSATEHEGSGDGDDFEI